MRGRADLRLRLKARAERGRQRPPGVRRGSRAARQPARPLRPGQRGRHLLQSDRKREPPLLHDARDPDPGPDQRRRGRRGRPRGAGAAAGRVRLPRLGRRPPGGHPEARVRADDQGRPGGVGSQRPGGEGVDRHAEDAAGRRPPAPPAPSATPPPSASPSRASSRLGAAAAPPAPDARYEARESVELAFVAAVQPRVTGSVRLKLFKGDCRIVGRKSPFWTSPAEDATTSAAYPQVV